jgi:hypothetical protein
LLLLQQKKKEPMPYNRFNKDCFLAAFRITGNIKGAARAAGITQGVPSRWKKKDPEFAREFQEVCSETREHRKAVMDRLAISGGAVTVWVVMVKGTGAVKGNRKGYARRPVKVFSDKAKAEGAVAAGIAEGRPYYLLGVDAEL